MKKNMSFVLLKQQVANSVRSAKTKVEAKLAVAVYRIRVNRLLDSCPDERSRSLLKARIEHQEKELEIRYARIQNYQQQMELGFLDMVEAVVLLYDEKIGPTLDSVEISEAMAKFDEGKSKLLMYSKWMLQLNPGSIAQRWIKIIEPINVHSFKTVEEWRNFVGSLPIC